MNQQKDADKGLSEQQLDDLDVNRQRERLERSRPGNQQSGADGNSQKSDDAQPGKERQ